MLPEGNVYQWIAEEIRDGEAVTIGVFEPTSSGLVAAKETAQKSKRSTYVCLAVTRNTRPAYDTRLIDFAKITAGELPVHFPHSGERIPEIFHWQVLCYWE